MDNYSIINILERLNFFRFYAMHLWRKNIYYHLISYPSLLKMSSTVTMIPMYFLESEIAKNILIYVTMYNHCNC